MTFSIKNHILYRNGVKVEQRPTKKLSAGRVLKAPIGLTIHYTAGLTAESAISTLTTAKVQASAHLVIDRDGTVYQLAPLNAVCWHAGPSSWRGRQMCNGFMIGIELVNAGPLTKKGNGKFYFEVAKSKECPKDEAVEGRQKLWPNTTHWQEYPEAQMEALIEVSRAIQKEYDVAEENIVGHENIAPTRKSDPGPAFPMGHFKSAVMHDRVDVDIETKVAKPLVDLTPKDLLNLGSKTVHAASTLKKAATTGAVVGVGTTGAVVSDPKDTLTQVQTTAQSVAETADAVSRAKDSVSALSDIAGWFSSHWIIPLGVFAAIIFLVTLYYGWKAIDTIIDERVKKAQTGVLPQ
jgi:N-acetylmuramoyl-L-alanine amidase